MTNIMLTKESGVLDIKRVNGRMQTVSGHDAHRQALEFKFEFFQDDWALDLSFGIPYYGGVLGHGVNIAALVGIFETAALNEPYVESVEGFTVEPNVTTRELKVTGNVLSVRGDAIPVDLTTGI